MSEQPSEREPVDRPDDGDDGDAVKRHGDELVEAVKRTAPAEESGAAQPR